MSIWDENRFEDKVVEILSGVVGRDPQHHFGRPFVTAYQLAMEFNHRFPKDVERLGYPVGGAGAGQRNSLAQYLAHQLSAGIKSGRITNIEGAFLSNRSVADLKYDDEGKPLISSLTGSDNDLSVFRLR